MTACKWDRERGEYLVDGEPCKRDEYGDPTRHCSARRTCSQHVGFGELTCGLCLARVRRDLRKIRDFSALLLPAATDAEYGRGSIQGVNSEAAVLAGPAADVEAWSWRKTAAKQGVAWHLSLVEDDDDWHPYTVLTRWEFMFREDYNQRRDDPTSTVSAAEYLDRNLNRVAQDENQDFALFRSEVAQCRNHLEIVLATKVWVEHGAPCPQCIDKRDVDPHSVRLRREYAHHCDDEACELVHYNGEEGDVWVCPRNREHWFTAAGYAEWLKDRASA